MATSNAEIMARLTLQADQFSSETVRRFNELKANAERVAPDIKRPIANAFAEVQKLANVAIQLPRTEGGALNLSGEIASLKGSAAAAEQRANALREMATAQLAAASTISDGAEQLRLEADAARAAATIEDDLARSIRGRITAMETVQTELNKTTSAVRVNSGAANDNADKQRAMRFAMQQTSYSVQDLMTQASMGGNVIQAFTVQGMQAAGAFTQVGGKAAAAANIIMGPWGLAVSGGLLLLAPYVDKLFESNDALEKEVEAQKKAAVQTEITRRAKELYRNTTQGVIDDLHAEIEATNKLITVRRTEAETRNIQLRDRADEARDRRNRVSADLVDARFALSRATAAPAGGSEYDVSRRQRAIDAAQANVDRLSRDLAKLDGELSAAEQAAQRSRLALAVERAKEVDDEQKAIDKRFDDERDALIARKDAAIATGKVIGDATQRDFEDIERRRKKAHDQETKRQQERLQNERAIGRASLGDKLETEQSQRLLSAAQGYAGASDRTASGRATLAELFREANVKVDPKITAWCAAFVNAVLATNNLPGTGSLAARSFLGYGSATDKPNKGDIVVLRRGNNAAEGHVGFYAGEGKNGNILVTGGNQGHSVSTASFKRSDVLGFRRAPTAADAYADEKRKAAEDDRERERAAKELDASLKTLTSTFDPAQAAVDKYRDTLADIAKLAGAGKITPDQALVYGGQARRDMEASLSRARDQAVREAIGQSEFQSGLDDYAALVRRAEENWESRQDEFLNRALVAGEAFRDAVAATADLFGVRIKGPLQLLLAPGGIGGQSTQLAKDITTALRGAGINLSPKAEQALASAAQGAAYGQIGGSVFASITGGRNNALASSIGGVLGNELGKEAGKIVAKEVGGGLGKALGGAAGPLGSIIGGVLGNVVGSLFQKAPKGQAGVTVNQYGSVEAGAATGTNAQATAGASSLAGAVSAGINRIAEMLGAKVTGATDVQIGVYKDMLRVNTTGGAIGGVKGSGALTFQTEEAAIAYAISDALKDGVLSGISNASLAILRSGQDLEKAIGKAVLIEGIPKALKAAVDPVGAAVDAVREKFAKLVAALDEGGATAEQRAQAEQLYNIELTQAKANAPAASQALRDFLEGMKVGSNSPLSLREQEAAAKATLNPYLSAIERGDTIDQGKYREAAQSYLDISRQLFGSTRQYFEAFDAVQAATNKAIGKIDNAAGISVPSVPDPFTKATASATEATVGAVKTGNEIAADQTDLLARNNALLERLIALAEAGDGSDFIGAARNFAVY